MALAAAYEQSVGSHKPCKSFPLLPCPCWVCIPMPASNAPTHPLLIRPLAATHQSPQPWSQAHPAWRPRCPSSLPAPEPRSPQAPSSCWLRGTSLRCSRNCKTASAVQRRTWQSRSIKLMSCERRGGMSAGCLLMSARPVWRHCSLCCNLGIDSRVNLGWRACRRRPSPP